LEYEIAVDNELEKEIEVSVSSSELNLLMDKEAEKVLEKAIETSPTNQQGYWSLAQTRLYQGRFEDALSLAEKAVALEPNLLQSHLIVVRITQIIQDDELTERKIKEAIEINPAWATSLAPAPN